MTIAETLPNGLRDLQVEGAIAIWQSRSKLLADQPGAGKTLQAEVALELDGQLIDPTARILITAPKTACQLMWARELQVRIASQYAVVIADLTGPCGSKRRGGATMAQRNTYLGQKMIEAADAGLPLIVLTNHEGLRWKRNTTPTIGNLWQNRWSAIIIDESHLVLPRTADDPNKFTQFWYGLYHLVTRPNPILLSMSGTPDNGKLSNRFGHYAFLHPTSFKGYWPWVKYFFNTSQNRWGGLDVFGLKRPEEWDAYQSKVMIRRTKQEMLKGLPPKQYQDVLLPLTDEHRGAYDRFEEELQERIAALRAAGGEENEREARSAEMVGQLRLRQMGITDWFGDQTGKWHAKGNREYSTALDWICEFLAERGFSSKDDTERTPGKVVISSFFTEVLAWLQEQLEHEGFGRIAILSGDTSLQEKLRIEEQFQRGELDVLLFSGWIGVAISLDAADDMIIVDTPFDPDRVEQLEDRIHRASSTGVKTFWRLIPEDTLQEVVVATMDKRFAETRRSYDGSRGVDFRRRIAKVKPEEAIA